MISKETYKNLVFSFFCGFFAGLCFLPIILNPTISEIELLRNFFLKTKIYFFVPFFFSFFFCLGIIFASFFQSKLPILFQFAKFVEIGVLNTFLDMGILNFLSSLSGVTGGLLVGVFNSVSFLVAATNSYFWNKSWTFQKGKAFKFKEFRFFIFISLIGLLINTGIVIIGTFLLKNIQVSSGAVLNLVKIFATLVAMIWNFFGYKIFVFK